MGKFDGLIGEGTFDPVAVVWELAETGAWVAVLFGHTYSSTTLPHLKNKFSWSSKKSPKKQNIGKMINLYKTYQKKSEPFFLVGHIADKDVYNHVIILIYKTDPKL